MGAGHDHGHTHGGPPPTGTAAAAYKGRLRIALGITLTVMVVEIVGGVLADSLALIADAAHMATDALGLGMALLAIHFANRPASPNRTFGYARAEILAALANCLLLLGVGGFLLLEAVERFITPAETRGGLTIAFALVGMVANMISLSLLMRGQKDSLNVRGAYLEVLADTLGSFAVLISAGVILATGWQAADPIASLVIGLMIVPRTVKLLRETLNVLLESAPKGWTWPRYGPTSPSCPVCWTSTTCTPGRSPRGCRCSPPTWWCARTCSTRSGTRSSSMSSRAASVSTSTWSTAPSSWSRAAMPSTRPGSATRPCRVFAEAFGLPVYERGAEVDDRREGACPAQHPVLPRLPGSRLAPRLVPGRFVGRSPRTQGFPR